MTHSADQSFDLNRSAFNLDPSLPVPDDHRLEMELEARRGLRRVPGITTELEDVTEVEYRQMRLERVVLIGVWTSGTLVDAETSLQELKALAETAGSQVLEGVVQRRAPPRPATHLGAGQAPEPPDSVR